MALIGTIIAVVIVLFLIHHYLKNQRTKILSVYFKIKEQLTLNLESAKFSNDWKKAQEINLNLLWLEVVRKGNNALAFYSEFSPEDEIDKLNALTLDEIRFPDKWELSNPYCYFLSQEIIAAYGSVFVDNPPPVWFRSEKLLPVPKEQIRKAALFTYDYFNLENPPIPVDNKDEKFKNISYLDSLLDYTFINTGNSDLPFDPAENYKVGKFIRDKSRENQDKNNLELIEWRSKNDWIRAAVNFADSNCFTEAYICLEKAKNHNQEDETITIIESEILLTQAEFFRNNNEHENHRSCITKSATLGNKEAQIWLSNHKE